MKKLKKAEDKEIFLKALNDLGGEFITSPQIEEIAKNLNIPYPHWFRKEHKVAYNKYAINLEVVAKDQNVVPMHVQAKTNVVADMNAVTSAFTENLIPEVDKLFVPFGDFASVKNIIKSKMFYPVYITGMSGNGKTFSVEQACAQLKREIIRVNFTIETDEDDLIGGFRLVNGDTKYFKGPVISAMEKGAVLLLDEIDLANPAKVMCLQSILEGKGYFVKKTGEYIKPAEGFTVVATANTKGKGSDDGRFIGTNVMNEAFLERFPVTFEQEYAPVKIEKNIIGKLFADLELNDDDFVSKLVDWADIIRKTFYDGGVDEIISTRRLAHIAKAYSIFGDRMTAINVCINRFDQDTKLSFLDLYTKIDSDVLANSDKESEIIETDF